MSAWQLDDLVYVHYVPWQTRSLVQNFPPCATTAEKSQVKQAGCATVEKINHDFGTKELSQPEASSAVQLGIWGTLTRSVSKGLVAAAVVGGVEYWSCW